jgi:hypothetical protein
MHNNLNIKISKDKYRLKENEYVFLFSLVYFQAYNVYYIEVIKEYQYRI